jgi:uncharacterized protein YneF (UPF0154 family)
MGALSVGVTIIGSIIFIVVVIGGVWLSHKMIRQFFEWYDDDKDVNKKMLKPMKILYSMWSVASWLIASIVTSSVLYFLWEKLFFEVYIP